MACLFEDMTKDPKAKPIFFSMLVQNDEKKKANCVKKRKKKARSFAKIGEKTGHKVKEKLLFSFFVPLKEQGTVKNESM